MKKATQSNQKIMDNIKIKNAYDNGHMFLENSRHKNMKFESSIISRLWYNLSTLSTPFDCLDMKILEKTNYYDFSRLQERCLKRRRKNWTLHQMRQKHVPRSYKTIYENRQNYIKFR